MSAPPDETALVVPVPAADAAVGSWRARCDPAAHVGVPPHVTVLFPFKPLEALTDDDHATLTTVLARRPAFDIVLSSLGWFGAEVVFLVPEDPAPFVTLTRAVVTAFPQFLPYGGAFDEIVPHVTFGQGHDLGALREAARGVRPALPVRQHVADVQLWTGPAPGSGHGRWHRVRSYPLAP
ncbi:MAG: 2'-5' RNA ligase family protein [Dermatophilaceae bacterium]